MVRYCLLGHAQSLFNPVPGYAEAVHAYVSHRFLLLLTDKTMIDKLRRWRNRWVSKPVPSWLPNTDRVGPFLGGGRVHSFPGGGSGRRKASRNSTITRLSCLGWSQEKIAEVVGLSRNRASEIVSNTNFGEINNLLSQGHDMEYVARHYYMDLPLCAFAPLNLFFHNI